MVERIVIVGSGTGGTFAANLLSDMFRKHIRRGDIRITLIGEGFTHRFQPANLDISFRGRAPHSSSRNELDLLRPGVDFVPEPAAKIDLENRRVSTSQKPGDGRDHTTYEYDHLVVATGAEAVPEMIPGLQEGSMNFHTGPLSAQNVWEAVKGFKRGRIGVLIAGVPHKCPPSPNEALFLLDEYFRRKEVRTKIELALITPYPRAYPSEKIARVVSRLFADKGIETVPFFNVDSVDPRARKVYSLEGDEFAYDLLIAVPPHRGTVVVRESGLGDPEGWIPTDKRSMLIKGHDDAFAIGDATDIPISKSGVVAHLESKAVAKTIASEIKGSHLQYQYNGRINCPMEVGGRKAVFVSATYDSPPAEENPSLIKYAMKRGFGSLYWSALSGRWEWMMDAYFGSTADEISLLA